MFQKIATDLFHRVVLSYKTTLLGIAIVAGDVVAQNLLASSNSVIHGIAVVLGFALTFAKEQNAIPPASNPPAAAGA